MSIPQPYQLLLLHLYQANKHPLLRQSLRLLLLQPPHSSLSPATSPVSAPTAPASAPFGQPTNDNSYDQDSADKILFKGRNNKNLRWIGRKRTDACCQDSAAAEHFPVTCKNANCTCFDSDDLMLIRDKPKG